jgi:hypothetical protein
MDGAKIQTYVPLLVERALARTLADLSQGWG